MVIGRSNIVGKPMGSLLLRENGTAGRLASPAEMAEPLLFLNSPMARFVSG